MPSRSALKIALIVVVVAALINVGGKKGLPVLKQLRGVTQG